jgi:hypothetical protein
MRQMRHLGCPRSQFPLCDCLGVLNFNTPDDVIIGRESQWKDVLLSRQFGYNRN